MSRPGTEGRKSQGGGEAPAQHLGQAGVQARGAAAPGALLRVRTAVRSEFSEALCRGAGVAEGG